MGAVLSAAIRRRRGSVSAFSAIVAALAVVAWWHMQRRWQRLQQHSVGLVLCGSGGAPEARVARVRGPNSAVSASVLLRQLLRGGERSRTGAAPDVGFDAPLPHAFSAAHLELTARSALEHGLQVLDAASASLPRRQRQRLQIDAVCARVEALLQAPAEQRGAREQKAAQQVDLATVAQLLLLSERAELTSALEHLREVESLSAPPRPRRPPYSRMATVTAGDGGDGGGADTAAAVATAAVARALDVLECRSDDPAAGELAVLRSCRGLSGSSDGETRQRALSTLASLSRVALETCSAAEVRAMGLVTGLLDSGIDVEEYLSSKCICVLVLRNWLGALDILTSQSVQRSIAMPFQLVCGERMEQDLRKFCWSCALWMVIWEILPKLSSQEENELLDKVMLSVYLGTVTKSKYLQHVTDARLRRLYELSAGVMNGDDTLMAVGSAFMVSQIMQQMPGHQVAKYSHLLQAAVSLQQRVTRGGQSVSWWRKHSEMVTTVSLGLCGVLAFLKGWTSCTAADPALVSVEYFELLQCAVDMCRMNMLAQMTARDKLPFISIALALATISIASQHEAHHEWLLASGVTEALFYVSPHDVNWMAMTLGGYASLGAVNLVGRNEGGVTLTQEAVASVLCMFSNYFDPMHRRSSYPTQRMLGDASAMMRMTIADANKKMVIQQENGIDIIIAGLLLDKTAPRRQEEGAGAIQSVCALALENLALSPVGASALRSHSGALESLRTLADEGMTDAARRHAKEALFELDETQRLAIRVDTIVKSEHIMLSYNWDHQLVIKRVHASLVRHGYSTWIDVEKMKGSTVEAMADAVEGAAVMLYGISRAYKESANCRLEAQYAFQREKDMVPLLVEEGYRADGWLGMFLGTRLYYSFCGSTMSSESAFEGKMEELCRELGMRGKSSGVSIVHDTNASTTHADQDRDIHALVQVRIASLKQGGEEAVSILAAALEQGLNVAEALLISTPRKARSSLKDMCERLESTLDGINIDSVERLLMCDESQLLLLCNELCTVEMLDQSNTNAEAAVASLLELLRQCCEDRAEALVAVLRRGDDASEDALISVLEHGSSVLHALSLSTPRKRRKEVNVIYESVEVALERVNAELIAQLVLSETAGLMLLSQRMCEVESLHVGSSEESETLQTVQRALDALEQCCDPVAGACRSLLQQHSRQRGLSVLASLDWVTLGESSSVAEVSAAAIVADAIVGVGASCPCAERVLALKSIGVLCFRNGAATVDTLTSDAVASTGVDAARLLSNAVTVNHREVLTILSAYFSVYAVMHECGCKLKSTAVLDKIWAAEMNAMSNTIYFFTDIPVEDMKSITAIARVLVQSSDVFVATGTAYFGGVAHGTAELLDAVYGLYVRLIPTRPSEAWWKERFDKMHIDSIYCNLLYAFFGMFPTQLLPTLAPSYASIWDKIVYEAVEVVSVLESLKITTRNNIQAMYHILGILVTESCNAARLESLIESGIGKIMLYLVENCGGLNAPRRPSRWSLGGLPRGSYYHLEDKAGMVAANLIGRNEGGITLTRKVIDGIINRANNFFDPSLRQKNQRLEQVVHSLSNAIIADVNKRFVVEHECSIDMLVAGLMLDPELERSTWAGAETVQQTCALMLENLALSSVSVATVRSHGGAITALRQLAACGSTEEARRCAEGALFELEESARVPLLVDTTTEVNGHIMLSYNWDHQLVIKRVHASLVRRGYSTWIDVEKMKGSTVEAMADAVEGAAVMLYGISRAYKESANCRLEAQYAFQREKDMVPLLVEEGYRADGWLGMFLGTRLYYSFCGSTMSSESAFEGKMEELCRELGMRGKTVKPSSDQATPGEPGRAAIDLLDIPAAAPPDQLRDPEARILLLESYLQGVLKIVASFQSARRAERRAVRARVEDYLDMLELPVSERPLWLASTWSLEQATAVSRLLSAALVQTNGMAGVLALLSALEEVAASCADGVDDSLLRSIQAGSEPAAAALIDVVQHGLDVLESMSMSIPRHTTHRKSVDTLYEEMESVLERLNDDATMQQLCSCDTSELLTLCNVLCAVKNMAVYGGPTGQPPHVERLIRSALGRLQECLDPGFALELF